MSAYVVLQVSKNEAVAELTRPVAGVLLTLMSNLCQTFRAADMAESVTHPADSEQLSQYIALLDDSLAMPTTASKSSTSCGGSRSSYASSFQVVLRGLLQHMIGCSKHCFILNPRYPVSIIPWGCKKLRYATHRSWNDRQLSSWAKLSCSKIALNRWIRTEIR